MARKAKTLLGRYRAALKDRRKLQVMVLDLQAERRLWIGKLTGRDYVLRGIVRARAENQAVMDDPNVTRLLDLYRQMLNTGEENA